MSRATTRVLLCASVALAIQGGACGTGAPAPDPALAGVVFVGGADEPALEQLVGATPATDASKGVVIDYPPTDTILDAATVVTFRWHAPAAAARVPTFPFSPPAEGAPRWLRDLLGPERAAHAGDSMNGAGYYLIFATDTKPELLRVFTTLTSYTPDAAAWKTLSSAMVWTQLTIASAAFQDDQLVPGEGPFVGSPVLFCIDKHPPAPQ
jgi:hypothetical protein